MSRRGAEVVVRNYRLPVAEATVGPQTSDRYRERLPGEMSYDRRQTLQAFDRGNLTVVRAKLNDFIAAVNAQTGKGVAVDAGQVLVTDTRYVLGTL